MLTGSFEVIFIRHKKCFFFHSVFNIKVLVRGFVRKKSFCKKLSLSLAALKLIVQLIYIIHKLLRPWRPLVALEVREVGEWPPVLILASKRKCFLEEGPFSEGCYSPTK